MSNFSEYKGHLAKQSTQSMDCKYSRDILQIAGQQKSPQRSYAKVTKEGFLFRNYFH